MRSDRSDHQPTDVTLRLVTSRHPETVGDHEPWPTGAIGVLTLPSGARVRGRSVRHPAPSGPHPTYGLYLTWPRPPATTWPQAWVRWPDFGLPLRFETAALALVHAYDASFSQRLEVGCSGGRGRTGTGLAALAVCAGLAPDRAIAHVRAQYDRHAVETPWQRAYLAWFARWLIARPGAEAHR